MSGVLELLKIYGCMMPDEREAMLAYARMTPDEKARMAGMEAKLVKMEAKLEAEQNKNKILDEKLRV